MAGIGFHLRKILAKDTYLATLQGYFHAAMVSCGPWIFTILSLLTLSSWSGRFLDRREHDLFQATVTYSFAFSLITTGIVQMGLSRYIADCLFHRDYDELLPSFIVVAAVVGGIQALIACIFWLPSPFSLVYKIAAIHLYVAISLLWLIIIYLSVIRNYRAITLSFVFGSLIALVFGGIGGLCYRVDGLLVGFTIGEIVVLSMLVYCLLRELPHGAALDSEVLAIFRRYPYLAAIGLLYNFGIWADKFVFWWGPQNLHVHYLIWYNPLYDNASFLAFLSAIPSLALFVIRIETSFYEKYRDYYRTILNHRGLPEITAARSQIVDNLQLSLVRLFKLQGMISLLAVVFAPLLIAFFNMRWLQLSLLRFLVIGAFFHILFLIMLIILLYFDLQKRALALVALFAVLNLAATWLTTRYDPRFYGLGYLLTSLVSMIAAFAILARDLQRLEYITFVRQSAATRR